MTESPLAPYGANQPESHRPRPATSARWSSPDVVITRRPTFPDISGSRRWSTCPRTYELQEAGRVRPPRGCIPHLRHAEVTSRHGSLPTTWGDTASLIAWFLFRGTGGIRRTVVGRQTAVSTWVGFVDRDTAWRCDRGGVSWRGAASGAELGFVPGGDAEGPGAPLRPDPGAPMVRTMRRRSSAPPLSAPASRRAPDFRPPPSPPHGPWSPALMPIALGSPLTASAPVQRPRHRLLHRHCSPSSFTPGVLTPGSPKRLGEAR
jgi:hypothetical protein